MHLDAIHKVLKFPMNIIRPSNAYAPGQLLYRIIPKAVVCGLTGQKLPLQGGGKARKSYIHARDLADAIGLVIEKGPMGKTYNVGPKDPISIRELVTNVATAMGLTLEQICNEAPDRLGQDSQYWLDSTAIAWSVCCSAGSARSSAALSSCPLPARPAPSPEMMICRRCCCGRRVMSAN